MNIDEFYKYEAERCDNGEMISGQIAFKGEQPFVIGAVMDYDDEFIAFESWWKVKPETVRKVAVKPLIVSGENEEEPNRYKCPNCEKHLFHQIIRDEYCLYCGMAIDWSE